MKKKWWWWLHITIITIFVINAFYAGYMVFFIVGGGPPLFNRVKDIAFETLIARRLYAIEAWITIIGLAIYLGLTEIVPRKMSGNPNGSS